MRKDSSEWRALKQLTMLQISRTEYAVDDGLFKWRTRSNESLVVEIDGCMSGQAGRVNCRQHSFSDLRLAEFVTPFLFSLETLVILLGNLGCHYVVNEKPDGVYEQHLLVYLAQCISMREVLLGRSIVTVPADITTTEDLPEVFAQGFDGIDSENGTYAAVGLVGERPFAYSLEVTYRGALGKKLVHLSSQNSTLFDRFSTFSRWALGATAEAFLAAVETGTHRDETMGTSESKDLALLGHALRLFRHANPDAVMQA